MGKYLSYIMIAFQIIIAFTYTADKNFRMFFYWLGVAIATLCAIK